MGSTSIEKEIKIWNFISKYLEGFKDFNVSDNLVDMGIVTTDFVSDLKTFIEKDFCVTFDGEDFSRNQLTIKKIANVIEKKQNEARINDLIFQVKMCLVNIYGHQVLPIDAELLSDLPYWNDGMTNDFNDQLKEIFRINVDLMGIKPLTFLGIATYIDQAVQSGQFSSGSNESPAVDEKKNLDSWGLKHSMVNLLGAK